MSEVSKVNRYFIAGADSSEMVVNKVNRYFIVRAAAPSTGRKPVYCHIRYGEKS